MNTITCVRKRLFTLFLRDEANQSEISVFDVKALYDAAYDEKAKARACIRTFKALLEKAEILDAAYRAQLPDAYVRLYGKAA